MNQSCYTQDVTPCPALQMPFRQAGTAHLGLDKRQASVLLVEVRAEVPFLTYGCNAFKSIHPRPVNEALGLLLRR